MYCTYIGTRGGTLPYPVCMCKMGGNREGSPKKDEVAAET